ncbi:hypothetical protein BDZ97DRAFT_1789772 [Flammula alnicola]|nr:hypothetical protein BDZ97DRAFT_1789772 [Flammula alnicola]
MTWPRSTTFKLLTAASLLSLLHVESAMAQTNITVPDTDKSITYSGQGTGDAAFCQHTANGNVVGGQPGCYNVPSMCAPSAAMGQSPDSAAEFTFKGSAIYVTGLLYSISPIYTVTLDGQATDVDGVRPSGPFICAPLFSAANLDPNADHTIKLAVKGPSPARNMTLDPQGKDAVFGLVNFIYTVPNGSSASNTTTSSGAGISSSTLSASGMSAGPANTNTAAAASTTSTSAADGRRLSMSNRTGRLILALGAVLGVLAGSL